MSKNKEVRRHIWRFRGRKAVTGLNVAVAVILAGVVLVAVNFLSYKYYWRMDVSMRRYYELSDQTKSLLASLDTDIEVISFFQKSNPLFDDVQKLLAEYEYEAAKNKKLRFKVRIIDPDRDLAKATRLAREYDIKRANIVIFRLESRRICLDVNDIDEYQFAIKDKINAKTRTGFGGEQAFSSSILSLTQVKKPVVYFLEGHGEHSIRDYGRQSGYSHITKIIQRDNMDVRRLVISQHRTIPQDCSALVIAGPDRKIPRFELDILTKYLERSGRLLVMVDPATSTGLAGFLEQWGIRISRDVVVDPSQTLTGTELVVTQYGEHPVVGGLGGIQTAFCMPRSVEPVTPSNPYSTGLSDKPSVSVLVASSAKGWAEVDLNQNPQKFDSKTDRHGPISIAVAMKRGSVAGIDVGIKPTHMVVLGDSSFVSNGWLARGHGNESFFMGALNWLVEREALIAVGPKSPIQLRLDLNRTQMKSIFMIIGLGMPLIVAFFGVLVWSRRRC
ncbi:MAG: GldG family protein [Kiritimatiellae bacterium]|nr:GldG family protein [Kiritimatiellia bacterium]